MDDKVEVCVCEKCGKDTEMNIFSQLSLIQTPYGEIWKKLRETKTCKVCGNETEVIIDFAD